MTAEAYKIRKIKTELDERISLWSSICNSKIDNVLQRYADENAMYKVGDILRLKKINKFIKVDKIEAKLGRGDEIWIRYIGKSYKKLKGCIVRTQSEDDSCIYEDNAMHLNVDKNNNVL